MTREEFAFVSNPNKLQPCLFSPSFLFRTYEVLYMVSLGDVVDLKIPGVSQLEKGEHRRSYTSCIYERTCAVPYTTAVYSHTADDNVWGSK